MTEGLQQVALKKENMSATVAKETTAQENKAPVETPVPVTQPTDTTATSSQASSSSQASAFATKTSSACADTENASVFSMPANTQSDYGMTFPQERTYTK